MDSSKKMNRHFLDKHTMHPNSHKANGELSRGAASTTARVLMCISSAIHGNGDDDEVVRVQSDLYCYCDGILKAAIIVL